jgi:uncharacterized protein YcbK (DUF882 family)
MKKSLLLVALILFSTPAFADSGFDNFSQAFKEQTESAPTRETTKSKGRTASQGHGSHCMPAEIRAVLDTVKSMFGTINVISAHRPGARIGNTGKPSYHSSCRAVDFVPPQNRYKEVAAYLKANWNGGVGTYSCGHRHIHIDTGPYVRYHKCG